MIVADTSRASHVHGVHGAEGLTYWKCLARRTGTAGAWEAVEWACLPPGGVSGAHLHTRTEEIYFILSGRGELLLDDTTYEVRPGTMALTGVGSTHGLRNTGEGELAWLVVEMSAPATHAVLTQDAPTHPGGTMPRSRVYQLDEVRSVDPSEAFDGPLSTIRIQTLRENDSETLKAHTSEHVLFVIDGTGVAEGAGSRAELVPGTAVTLPLGTEAHVLAHEGGLQLFHAEMDVRGPGESTR
ncbi:cupin domain-containing protein [Streptomyces sp. NBC_01335]|uniref:cupin domain-containing protein n=1 Tax=Streptomyces sp. NBC_01335 TaxID=2903828 RepID=UPI002E0E3D42|nr:cupin domain-containing protein [Streptomyces sp. NBC_01335]